MSSYNMDYRRKQKIKSGLEYATEKMSDLQATYGVIFALVRGNSVVSLQKLFSIL